MKVLSILAIALFISAPSFADDHAAAPAAGAEVQQPAADAGHADAAKEAGKPAKKEKANKKKKH